jgi:phasin family protein
MRYPVSQAEEGGVAAADECARRACVLFVNRRSISGLPAWRRARRARSGTRFIIVRRRTPMEQRLLRPSGGRRLLASLSAAKTSFPECTMTSQISQQLIDTQSAGIAAFGDFAQRAFEGFEKVTQLNVQAIKTSLAERQAIVSEALSPASPFDLFLLQTQLTEAAATKAKAYMTHLGEIVAQNQLELIATARQGFANYAREFEAWISAAGDDAQQTGADAAYPMLPSATAISETEQQTDVAILDSTGNVVSGRGSRRRSTN